jgi:diadenylate cyclase
MGDYLSDSLVAHLFFSMELKDLLDIGLMSAIFYRVLLVMRGTRAFQSLVGLIGLGGVYLVAAWLDLFAIHWMLSKFFVYIVLAVIILFQQDIRRGLARAGGRLFSGFSAETSSSANEVVVQTLFALASRRIGSLVVLERHGSLNHYVEAGHALNSGLSQELLQAIFHPTSPLHDGAVVIRNGRVAAAKVFLPLSRTSEIDGQYGTRHRAAIGLSEETDAVVLAVSEERGDVSLVVGGRIVTVEDTNELRGHLQRIFGENETDNEQFGEHS